MKPDLTVERAARTPKSTYPPRRVMAETTPAPPKPLRTGHCGLGNPDWSHRRCVGSFYGHPCPCDCHNEALAHYRAELARYHALGDWLMANRPDGPASEPPPLGQNAAQERRRDVERPSVPTEGLL